MANLKKKRTRTKHHGKWFKLERLAGDEMIQNVEGHEFHVREEIAGVLVVQTPRELSRYPEHLVRVRDKLGKMLEEAGVKLPILMIPDDIRFARFRECAEHENLELERRITSGFQAKELTISTPTKGSA